MLTCVDCGGVDVTVRPPDKNGKVTFHCKECKSRKKPKEQDQELIEELVRVSKQKQNQMDRNRIERKSFREHARIENAYEQYVKSIDETLKSFGEKLTFAPIVKTPPVQNSHGKEIGVIHVTDTHFNELIDLPTNKYDMTIAGKRLRALADEAIWMFSVRGIKDVVIAFGGDLLNSDRRLDELLSQATNRARATVVSVELIMSFLTQLRTHFNLTVVSVLGNESRADKEMSFSNNVASNSYDYTIIAMVKKLVEYSKAPNIVFGPIDRHETVIDINGQNVLLVHDISRATDSQMKTQSLIGRYYLSGTPIDYILSGHVHSTKQTPFASRGGSLAGSNSYNEISLGLISRASQNIGYFGKNYRNITSVDLQNVYDREGYPIQGELMEYNSKAASKLDTQTTVFKVII